LYYLANRNFCQSYLEGTHACMTWKWRVNSTTNAIYRNTLKFLLFINKQLLICNLYLDLGLWTWFTCYSLDWGLCFLLWFKTSLVYLHFQLKVLTQHFNSVNKVQTAKLNMCIELLPVECQSVEKQFDFYFVKELSNALFVSSFDAQTQHLINYLHLYIHNAIKQ